ncbi:Hsp33 family molecular chaperone HslO [Vibrio sp. RC27]
MANNTLSRYLFDDMSVRGELVQLDETYQRIISSKEYPAAIEKLLGELLVATTLLTATIKFEGSITLQLQGDGPVSLIVVNGDNNQNVRGVARWQGDIPSDANVRDLMGKGHLVINIEPKKGERYQGIVGLESDSLSEIIEGYFERSEQLKTRIWIRTGVHQGAPHAAGMLLQVIPDETGSDDDFEHLEQLTNTVKSEELFSLGAQELLYRLYNQEKVRLFDPQEVAFHCGCSRERSGAAIITIDPAEIAEILEEDGKIAMHCDYCGSNYEFNKTQIDELLIEANTPNNTLH